MRSKHITIIPICALLLAACNRAPTDEGTNGQSTTANGGQANSAAPTARPVTPTPSAPPDGAPAGSAVNNPAPMVATNNAAAIPETTAAAKPADNTGRNVRDRSDATVTPGDQSEAKGDVETTRQIRRTITQSDQLSVMAKNIKIITSNGKVTLRGPVKTDAEKQQIAEAAKGVAGVTDVDNQLEVKATQ